jgi:transcriptional regulator with XRE-family HTH domain
MPPRLATTGAGVRRDLVQAGMRAARDTAREAGRVGRRRRLEAGLSARQVAGAIGAHPASVRAIEAGDPHVSLELRARYAAAIGSQLRLVLGDAPDRVPLRDAVHARMHEAVLGLIAPAWRALPDRPVNHAGIRGSIDLVLIGAQSRVVGSTEVKSLFVSLEELIRRSGEKRVALAEGGTIGLAEPAARGYRVAELVIARDCDANRAIVARHREYLAAAFPGDPGLAVAALTKDPALLPDRSLVWLRLGGRPRFVIPRTALRRKAR